MDTKIDVYTCPLQYCFQFPRDGNNKDDYLEMRRQRNVVCGLCSTSAEKGITLWNHTQQHR